LVVHYAHTIEMTGNPNFVNNILGGSKMKVFKRISLFVCAITMLAGCGVNNGANDQGNANNNTTNTTNVNNRNNNIRNVGTNDTTRMQVADEAQNKIENLDEVRDANIIVTNRNAYVAVVLEDNSKGDVRRQLENKISDQVKQTDNNIQNVFVSSNPDFVDRMGDYGEKIESGKPVRGLFEEFNEMVQRVFPNAR